MVVAVQEARPPRSSPRVSRRGAAMKAALRARPHSGRTCDQSRLRARHRFPCSGSSRGPAACCVQAGERCGLRKPLLQAREIGGEVCRHALFVEDAHIIGGGVRAGAQEPAVRVRDGDALGRKTDPHVRVVEDRGCNAALASPVCPPQAPQSSPAACGLLTVVLPWPARSTSRPKGPVIDMAFKTASAIASFWSAVKPVGAAGNGAGLEPRSGAAHDIRIEAIGGGAGTGRVAPRLSVAILET